MKDTKRALEHLTFCDSAGIERRLAQRAAQGWMLESVNKFYWQYRRIDPAELTFSVTYFPNASEFDPRPSEAQETFQDYCAQAGWTPVTRWAQMEIFCTDRPNPVPIETDAVTQVETVHRAMRKNFLPGQVAMLALALFQVAFSIYRFQTDPLAFLTDTFQIFSPLLWVLLAVYTGAELLGYRRWHRRAVATAQEDGVFLQKPSNSWMGRFAMGVLVVVGLAYIFSVFRMGGGSIALASLLFMAGAIGVTLGVKSLLKKRGVSAKINRVITMATAFVIPFALMALLLVGIFSGAFRPSGRQGAETYEAYGQMWDVYHDPIPLRVEDLLAVDYDGYSTERREDASILATQTEYTQQGRMGDRDIPYLEYHVLRVKVPALYDFCRETLLRHENRHNWELPEEFWRLYRETDAAPWGAEAAYRLYDGDDPRNIYLLCFEDQFATLRFDWDPTPAQMAIAGERLKDA